MPRLTAHAALVVLLGLATACSLSDGTRDGEGAATDGAGGSPSDGGGGSSRDSGVGLRDGGVVVSDGSTPGDPAPRPDAGGPDDAGAPGSNGGPDTPPPARCCTADADCGAPFVCAAGRCFEGPLPCVRDADCARLGEFGCRDGRCAPDAAGCVSDADCPVAHACVDTPRLAGVCVPETTTCTQRCGRVGPVVSHIGLNPARLERPTDTFRDHLEGTVETVYGDALDLRVEGGRTVRIHIRPSITRRLVEPNTDVVFDWEHTATQTRSLLRTAEGRLLFAGGSGRPAPLAAPLDWALHVEDIGCTTGDVGDCIQTRHAVLVYAPGPAFLYSGESATVPGPGGAPARLIAGNVLVDENACEPDERGPSAQYHFLPP